MKDFIFESKVETISVLGLLAESHISSSIEVLRFITNDGITVETHTCPNDTTVRLQYIENELIGVAVDNKYVGINTFIYFCGRDEVYKIGSDTTNNMFK